MFKVTQTKYWLNNSTYQVSMYCSLFFVFCNSWYVGISVFKVGVKICLVVERQGLGLNAGLLVWQLKLIEDIHILQRIRKCDLVSRRHDCRFAPPHSHSMLLLLVLLPVKHAYTTNMSIKKTHKKNDIFFHINNYKSKTNGL